MRYALKMIVVTVLLSGHCVYADIRLPKLFSDGVVLQRQQPIPLWGSGDPGQMLEITLAGRTVMTRVGENGRWRTQLPALPAGGPYTLRVAAGEQTVEVRDVLLGDVWLCSGQSNMEWTVAGANRAEEEIREADYPGLRMFTVEKDYAAMPRDELAGGRWQPALPEFVGDFSAVGYFFGRRLHRELEVPIGLIHSSWGGTDIQPWTSWETMVALEEYRRLDRRQVARAVAQSQAGMADFRNALQSDRGAEEGWYRPDTTGDWTPVAVPALWSDTDIGDADGIVWFRTEFELPAELAGKPAALDLGPVDDEDHTYLNGQLIGTSAQWDEPRRYPVAGQVLRPGTNVLVVRVADHGGGGGLYGEPGELYLEVDGQRIALAGDWRYRTSVLSSDFGVDTAGPNAYPSLLYNAMIHPLTRFPIAGVVWYQGENNVGQAHRYRELFKNMIGDWRGRWGRAFPFYWVQLANHLAPAEQPGDSAWAELREAQDLALALPRTGQAVAIDLGEADDIHPRNKQDVGLRLARVALKRHYGRQISDSGPRFRSMRIERGRVLLAFDHVDGGLVAADADQGQLRGFAIAGADRRFEWAQARIEGDRVVVWSNRVERPVAVRYAWADNPAGANLYNHAGLPAAPFRTDTWAVTEGAEPIGDP